MRMSAPSQAPQQSSHGNVAAVLLLLVQLAGVAVCGFLGIMLVFVSDSCDSTSCNTDLIVLGMAITALVPLLLWVVSLVHVIVRGRRDESNWWVPILWMIVSGAAAVVGILVAFQGGPNTFS
ncbi:MAG: hypothetical protein JWQ74_870 [Marmoricola sp.]|nr:hypothetical protein [Marmoricola sp.]